MQHWEVWRCSEIVSEAKVLLKFSNCMSSVISLIKTVLECAMTKRDKLKPLVNARVKAIHDLFSCFMNLKLVRLFVNLKKGKIDIHRRYHNTSGIVEQIMAEKVVWHSLD